MKKVTVVYWSSTGNTQAMAEAVVDGIKGSGSDIEVSLLNVSEASITDVVDADGIALGCPSMGAEVLEESEMEPFVEDISGVIAGKPLVLFGSYDWGTGEWMENWHNRMVDAGAILLTSGLIVNLEPDEEAIKKCEELGSTLVASL
jgi:flavodoxin I